MKRLTRSSPVWINSETSLTKMPSKRKLKTIKKNLKIKPTNQRKRINEADMMY